MSLDQRNQGRVMQRRHEAWIERRSFRTAEAIRRSQRKGGRTHSSAAKDLVPITSMTGPELLFVAADATWRCEAAKVLEREQNDPGLALLPEACGEPGTLLRTAFEARERAYATWCREAEGAAD